MPSEPHHSSHCLFPVLILVACLLCGCSTPTELPQQDKVNFVFILIDDLGWKDLSSYGSTFYETPSIDRLASSGMRFTDAYASAPVCSPTRASILTGKYPATLKLTDWIAGRKQWLWAKLLVPQFNLELPLEEETVAESLKPHGYVAAHIGKWHLGDRPYYPEDQGFDVNIGGTAKGAPPTYFCPYDISTIEGCQEGEYLTDRLTDEAERFIEKNKDTPFFLHLSHFAVHTPLEAKKSLISKYQAKVEPDQEQRHAVYAAMIESVDVSVGRIMKKLGELGISDKTVVILTSDNGGLVYETDSQEAVTSNAPLRAGKGHLYEGGIRVPLIVSWPGVTAPGSTCKTPVTSLDFSPTIVAMAGIDNAEDGVEGVSIVPLLRQASSLRRKEIYWHYPHYSNQGGEPGGAVRQGSYKLIEFYKDNKLELYNLQHDLGEQKDLADAMPEKRDELHRLLVEWRASVHAQMPTENPSYDPARSDQGLTGAQR